MNVAMVSWTIIVDLQSNKDFPSRCCYLVQARRKEREHLHYIQPVLGADNNLPISWLQDREELNKAKLLSENLPSNFWSLHWVGPFDLHADYSNSFCLNELYPVWCRTMTMDIRFMMIIWKMNSHFRLKDRKVSSAFHSQKAIKLSALVIRMFIQRINCQDCLHCWSKTCPTQD